MTPFTATTERVIVIGVQRIRISCIAAWHPSPTSSSLAYKTEVILTSGVRLDLDITPVEFDKMVSEEE